MQQSPKLPIVGGLLAAIGASLCCAGPFVLLSIGVGGAWIGKLTAFEPYRPLLIVVVLALFGWGGWLVHRPITLCTPGSVCALPVTRKRYQVLFWLAVFISLMSILSPYWIPLIA